MSSREKLNTLCLPLQTAHGQEIRQGADLPREVPTLKPHGSLIM